MRRSAAAIFLSLTLLIVGMPHAAAQTQSEGSVEGLGDGLLPDSLGPGGLTAPGANAGSSNSQLAYPNLGSQLSALVEAGAGDAPVGDAVQPGAATGLTLPSGTNSTLSAQPLLLTIQLDGNRDGVLEFLDDNGVTPLNILDDYLEVDLPVGLLGPLAQQTGVSRVREMPRPFKNLGTVTSQAVRAHGADAWHDNGFTGDGVKVGVIDTSTTATSKDGFTGLRALRGTDLPATVVGRCYTDVGKPTGSLANCDAAGGDAHGTRVAESLMDVAPDADLYIANPISWADLHSTVVWMHGQGVKVIVYPIGWGYHGGADGTSPFTPSPLNTVKWAADNGITWVNSAGNSARKTWYGAFADSDNDNYHEWAGSGGTADEAQVFALRASDTVSVSMRWDDSWVGATKDLDLVVTYSSSLSGAQTSIGSSADIQAGRAADVPYEGATLTVNDGGDGYYWFYVKKKATSSAPSWVQFQAFSGDISQLDHYSEGGSITTPADSAHPGMLAVGAAPWSNNNSIETYSSRGPTPDGRTKPDIVGADCAWTRSGSFCGTSQAAPHVGGLAALVLERNPAFTPQQVTDYLKAGAADRGATGTDNTWGHGFASLPSSDLPSVVGTCMAPLSGSGSVNGVWGESCVSLSHSGRSGRYARFFTFSLDQPASVKIDLTSSVDTYLFLRRGLERKQGHLVTQDDDGGPGVNSRISRTLAAGDYTIEATTYSRARKGPFTLAVAGIPTQAAADPVVGVTAGGDVVEGGDATFTISTSPAPTTALTVDVDVTQNGSFGVVTGTRQVVIPTSGAATLTVATTDDNDDEPDGSVTVSVGAGTGYTVSPTANSATVAIADDDDLLPVVSIVAGSGFSLDTDITEGEHATFTVAASPAPSAALTVRVTVGAVGNFGVTTSSQLVTVPTTGSLTFTVATSDDSTDEPDGSVTATVGSGTGYTVSASQSSAVVAIADDDDPPAVVDACVAALSGDGSVSGAWDDTCVSVGRSGRYARFFTFRLDQRTSVSIDLSSSIDTYMYLRSGLGQRDGSWVANDDDNGPGLNSRITRYLPAGDYTIEATTFSRARSGPFTLTVAGLPPQTVVVPDPVVSVTPGGDVTEGADATFTVSASPAPSAALTVNVTVSSSGDFGVTASSRQVTVPTSGSASFAVATSDDSTDEPDGSVTASIGTGTGYAVSSSAGSATVAVADDDDPPAVEPEVSVTAGGGVTEGGSASFTVSASPAPTAALTVDVTVAQVGSFGVTTGVRQVTIPTSGTLTLTITTSDDSTDEADGSVSVTVNTGAGYTVSSSQSSAVVAVADDDPRSVSCSPAAIPEGQTGYLECQVTDASWGRVQIPGADRTSAARYGVVIEAIPAGTESPTAPCFRGGVDTGQFRVAYSSAGDGVQSPNLPDIGLEWQPVDPAQGDRCQWTTQPTPLGSITITDDYGTQPDPQVSVTAGGAVTEGGSASFTVSASPSPSTPLNVDINIAQTGNYGAATGSRTVTIPTSGSIAVNVATTDDNTDEADGSVSVTVNTGTGYTVSPTAGSASVTVTDNDDPPPAVEPEVSVTAHGAVTEGNPAAFTVSASPAPTAPLTVGVSITQAGDYGVTEGPRQVTIPTSGSVALTVTTSDDSTDEPDGSATATINTASGYTVSPTAGSASVAITDDDDPPPEVNPAFSVEDASGVEGDMVRFRVTLSQPSNVGLRVWWGTQYGGDGNYLAMPVSEFWIMSNWLVFQPGETEQWAEVYLNDDRRREQDEEFLVHLDYPIGPATIADGTATMTIIDND